MARTPQLLDHLGRPYRKAELTREIAAPTIGGVRSPLGGYPGDGLDPRRLGQILREADAGDPTRFLELAETIEERDPHYSGVLATRKRSVSQLEITVEDASDDPIDVRLAEDLRSWLNRGELQDELFHILDAIGKGYSFTEIIWDTSLGQWRPDRLEWRDPRWFTFERVNLTTPMLLNETGQEVPLTGGKFIQANIRAKSGIPTRAGLARVVMWPYLFKKYTERDWTIFSQTYGQPLRVGKFDPSASEKDRATLMRAVANIAGDCAAIIPESMMIEFIEAKNVGSSTDLYEKRGDWYDKQVSKAVLGQTATTDAETGGLGSGKEHRQVQEDIERADANALGAVLTRDLAVPFVQLNHGPRLKYPRIKIERPEAEDLAHFANAVTPFIDRGLEVDVDDIYAKFNLRQPGKEAKILRPSGKIPAQGGVPGRDEGETGPERAVKHPLKGLKPESAALAAESGQSRSAGNSGPPEDAADVLAVGADPVIRGMLDQIGLMMDQAEDLDELRELVLAGFPDVDSAQLSAALGEAFAAWHLGGIAAVAEDANV